MWVIDWPKLRLQLRRWHVLDFTSTWRVCGVSTMFRRSDASLKRLLPVELSFSLITEIINSMEEEEEEGGGDRGCWSHWVSSKSAMPPFSAFIVSACPPRQAPPAPRLGATASPSRQLTGGRSAGIKYFFVILLVPLIRLGRGERVGVGRGMFCQEGGGDIFSNTSV